MLNQPVLVLNKSWRPIRVAPLEEALKKLTVKIPKARIIDPSDYTLYTWEDWAKIIPKDEDRVIRGVKRNYRVPEVILVEYDKLPFGRVSYSRRMIYKRDNNTCQYCGRQLPSEDLNIDHVIPRCQGGQTTWTNTVVSCIACNMRKDGRTPEQAGMKLIREPLKPKFSLLKYERRVYPKSWKNFLSEVYWNIELENDNPD